MKRSDYRRFVECVMYADCNDWIWWQGYLWIRLTDGQLSNLCTVLRMKACVKAVHDRSIEYLELPSGIRVRNC